MAKNLYREIGRPGTEIWSGYIERPSLSSTIIADDYLSAWTYDTIDKMLRSDGQVAAIWRAIVNTIQSAEWYIEPASDSKQDKKIARFVEDNLWPIWGDFLRQALLYLAYGFMVFEVVYEERNGQIYWKNLAPRLPWTIQRWIVKNNKLDHVVQYAQDPETGSMQYYEIPAYKILRFTNEQQGLQYEGVSIFRAAYKHWKIKDVLYKIAAIRHERWGVGIPVGTLPEHVSDEEEKEYKKILKQLRSNEAAYIYLPKGSSIEESIQILTPSGGQAGSQDLMELIRHHDVLIARSVLAEFVSLGESRFGSRAVSRDLVDLFMLALEGITKHIGHVVTYGNPGENLGITDLVRLNFGENVEPPRLVCGRVRRTDVPQMISSLARLIRAGGITPDDSVENSLRALLGLPQKPTKKEQRTLTEMQEEETHPFELAEPGVFWRELFPWEEHVNFAEYQSNFNRLEDQFVNAWREILPNWVDLIRQEIGSSVAADDIPRLRSLALPPGKMADAFYRVLLQAYEYGKHSVKEELEAQVKGFRIERKLIDRQDGKRAFQELRDVNYADLRNREEEEKKVLRGHAEAAAENLSRKVKRAAEYWALAALTHGQIADVEEVVKPLLELSDKDARLEAYAAVSAAWGMGRNIAGDAVRPLIYYGIYSAVLDQNTCAVCRAEDGRIVMPGEHATPNPACLGGLRCRCVTLWVLADPVGLDEINELWDELGW